MIACLITGCQDNRGASSPIAPQIFPGPHGGLTFTFPREKAFVEVVNEGGRGRRANNTAAVAYFLGPDKSSPLSSLPSDVKLQIKEGGEAKTLSLKPIPSTKKSETLNASRFASEVGPYTMDGRECVLSGTLEGKDFSFEFDGGRLR